MADRSQREHDVSRVAGFWTDNAQRFDEVYRRRSLVDRLFRQAIPMRQEMALEALDGFTDPTVCDIGCGSGRQLIAALEAGASRAVGIDLSPTMVRMAKDSARERGLAERLEFHVGDAHTVRIDETFDAVWALGVFDYVREPLPLLVKMAELSRGRVVASFRRMWALRNPLRKITYAWRGCPIYFQTRSRILELFREAGLTVLDVSRLGPSGYLAVGEKAS